MKLALFDLDNTLLDLDSDHEWGEFLIRQGLVDAVQHRIRNDQFYQDYQAGTLDAVAYNEFVFEFLSANTLPTLHALREEYIQTVIMPAMRPKGMQKIAEHRAQGHCIVLITATNSFVTQPIAQAFGIEHLIASEPEMNNDTYTGKLKGAPCFQSGKINCLHAWIQQQGIDAADISESWGYSDSYNDLPLLNFVQHPCVVTPDARLLAHAQDQGWANEDWSLR